MAKTWHQTQKIISTFDKKDVIIYDDNHENGNQHINVIYKNVFQFKIQRPFMNKLKKLGYKIERREL